MDWFRIRRRLKKGRKVVVKPVKEVKRTGITRDKYVAWLKKKGFVKLGCGAFSAVLSHPNSDKVIKINHTPDLWSQYILWGAKTGWMGKFVPRVYSYKYHESGFSVAVMEKLKGTVSEECCGSSHPLHGALSIFEMSARASANDNLRKAVDIFQPGLGEFVKDFTTEFKGRYDLHAGNAMIRQDGSFVLTDPVYGGNCVKERLRFRDLAQAA